MTTVALNKNQIAADQKASTGNGHFNFGPKLRHYDIKSYYPHPFTIGFCGDIDHILQVLEFFESPLAWVMPKKLWKAEFVMLTADHKMFTFQHPNRLMSIQSPFYATGSGGQFANGAMQFGATPYEAVKASIKLDNYSGYRVDEKTYE